MAVDKSTLEAKAREGAGKGVARKLRTEGLVPAVVYGKHLEKPVHVSVDPKSVRQSINTPHKFNTLITLKMDGASHQVLLKDFQVDPVTRDPHLAVRHRRGCRTAARRPRHRHHRRRGEHPQHQRRGPRDRWPLTRRE